jgi:ABC-type phosphate transport system substrate-binding protein
LTPSWPVPAGRLASALLAGGALVAAIALPRPAAAQGTIAVIVNRSNPVDDISGDDLRRLYLGTTTVFSNNERVVLYELPDLREAFYRTVLGMNGDRVKRHWIGLVFSGGGARPPKDVADVVQLRALVGSQRGAIGFLDPGQSDPSVKVLRVDGFKPADAGYPLRDFTPLLGGR